MLIGRPARAIFDWLLGLDQAGRHDDRPHRNFLDQIREAAKVRGLLNQDHVQIVRTALVNSRNAAGDDVRLMQIWDDIRGCISDNTLTVKERLAEMGRIAERFDEQHESVVNEPAGGRCLALLPGGLTAAVIIEPVRPRQRSGPQQEP